MKYSNRDLVLASAVSLLRWSLIEAEMLCEGLQV